MAELKAESLEFLGRLTVWRNDAQLILFRLLNFVSLNQSKLRSSRDHNAIFQLLVGAAFSLWRAVFLADGRLSDISSLAAAQDFLVKVVSDNTIAYSQEKETRPWTSGFYIGHIQYRLFHLHKTYGNVLGTIELDDIVEKWPAFEDPFAPQDEKEFFDRTIVCQNKLLSRLAEIVG